jgi:hypothetical protein
MQVVIVIVETVGGDSDSDSSSDEGSTGETGFICRDIPHQRNRIPKHLKLFEYIFSA